MQSYSVLIGVSLMIGDWALVIAASFVIIGCTLVPLTLDITAARFWTYCAIILTAISGTVCDSISNPTGHATCASCSAVANPSALNCSKMIRAFRRLPIMPKNANGF